MRSYKRPQHAVELLCQIASKSYFVKSLHMCAHDQCSKATRTLSSMVECAKAQCWALDPSRGRGGGTGGSREVLKEIRSLKAQLDFCFKEQTTQRRNNTNSSEAQQKKLPFVSFAGEASTAHGWLDGFASLLYKQQPAPCQSHDLLSIWTESSPREPPCSRSDAVLAKQMSI